MTTVCLDVAKGCCAVAVARGLSVGDVTPAAADKWVHAMAPGLVVAQVTAVEKNAAYVFAKITARPAAGPHFLDVVEGAHLGTEDMNDDVAGIDQHPVGAVGTLDLHALDPRLVQLFLQMLRHGGDLPIGGLEVGDVALDPEARPSAEVLRALRRLGYANPLRARYPMYGCVIWRV